MKAHDIGLAASPTVAEALERVTQRQFLDGRKWAPRFRYVVDKYLIPAYGTRLLTELDTDELEAYAATLRSEGYAPSTINLMFFPLRAAMRRYEGKIGPLAAIPRLHIQNARHVFFEREQFERFVAQLSEPLRAPAWFAYFTGWRMKSEVLALRWEYVRWESGMIVLPPDKTKRDIVPREWPFAVLPELEALLREQRRKADALMFVPPWVFFRAGGKPVKKMEGAWNGALHRAFCGCGQRVAKRKDGVGGGCAVGFTHTPHDLRRTAAKNLRRKKVPDDVIMALVGWRSLNMLYRYLGRADEDALRDAVARLAIR